MPQKSSLFVASVAVMACGVLFALGVSVVGANKKPQSSDDNQKNQIAEPLSAPTLTFINPKRGASEPKVTIFVYGDYGCAACRTLESTLNGVLAKTTDVAVVWKDMPNEVAHAGSGDAAVAARCAQQQGAFWDYHDLLFAQAEGFSVNSFVAMAQALDLDAQTFGDCISNQATRPLVVRDIDEALRLGITATPFLFIGDRRVSGAIEASAIEGLISEARRSK
jgi:protein-disulfide isomerase